jgi:ABC-type Fe3+ transport system substrate-binding protein
MPKTSAISRRDLIVGSLAAGAMFGSQHRSLAQASADWQAGAPPEWFDILAAARREGQVNIAAFPALSAKMSAAFKRDTGIQINFIGGNTAEQSARLAAEARAKNVTIDAAIGGAWELQLMRENLLEPILPQLILPGVAPENFHGGKQKFFDNAGRYLLVGSNYVFGWLVVNTDLVKPEEITTWRDLLKPEFLGKIAAVDPRFPGSGQGVSNWLFRSFGLDFIKELYIGQQVKMSVDYRQLMDGLVRGTTPILIGMVQSQVERFRASFKTVGVVLPEDAPGYLASGFSVIKQAQGIPHPNAAKVFTNWYVSRPGQEVYESVMLEVSRRNDVNTGVPDYLVARENIKYFDYDNEDVFFEKFAALRLINAAFGQR